MEVFGWLILIWVVALCSPIGFIKGIFQGGINHGKEN